MDASAYDIIKRLRGDLAGSKLLIMGQTVFWDEPTKAVLRRVLDELGPEIEMLVGIHDVDYFSRRRRPQNTGKFILTVHDDGPTSELWVAAAEASRLFGSETLVTRALLNEYGIPIESMGAADSHEALVVEATAAWGWRGIAMDAEEAPICVSVRAKDVLRKVSELVQWATSESAASLEDAQAASGFARDLLEELEWVASKLSSDATLPALYGQLAEAYWRRMLGRSSDGLRFCTATELFRFNTKTAGLPRFRFLNHFLNPKTREAAKHAYNEAVRDSEIYSLERFSEAALPFDIVLLHKDRPPCRGTICVADNEVAILGPCSTVLHTSSPPANVHELAALIEAQLGPDAIVVGKALTLVPMILSEWVWVLHHLGSAYTPRTQKMVAAMRAAGLDIPLRPILRVEHDAWSALEGVEAAFRLPPHLARAFGAQKVTADEFAKGWKEAVVGQEELLAELKRVENPEELTEYLSHEEHSAWFEKLERYVEAHGKLLRLSRQIERLRHDGIEANSRARETKAEIQRLEKEKGQWVRERIRPLRVRLKEDPGPDRMAEIERELSPLEARRAEMEARIDALRKSVAKDEARSTKADEAHHALEGSPEFVEARSTVTAVEAEAHLLRMRLVRDALLTVKGLPYAGARPSWWWFPMVDPSGKWFENLTRAAKFRLEEL